MKGKKEEALIKAGVGLATKDKDLALEGINEFIRLGIMELEMDRMADEAEFSDACVQEYGDPDY